MERIKPGDIVTIKAEVLVAMEGKTTTKLNVIPVGIEVDTPEAGQSVFMVDAEYVEIEPNKTD